MAGAFWRDRVYPLADAAAVVGRLALVVPPVSDRVFLRRVAFVALPAAALPGVFRGWLWRFRNRLVRGVGAAKCPHPLRPQLAETQKGCVE